MGSHRNDAPAPRIVACGDPETSDRVAVAEQFGPRAS
jgi:hypothetical protein